MMKGFTTLFIGTHDAPMHFPPTMTARNAINNVLKGRVEVVAEREVVNALGETLMVPEIVRSKHLFEGLHNRITGIPASFNLRNLALREGFRCQYDPDAPLLKLRSSEPETRGTFDHIVPASQGGERAWLNAAFTSETLNVWKADRTPREAGLYLLHEPWVPTIQDMLYLQIRHWLMHVSLPERWKYYIENIRPTPNVLRVLEKRGDDIYHAA